MSQITQQLQAFKFVDLFNQLGWDRLTIGFEKELSGHVFSLQPIAQKRGIQVRFRPMPFDKKSSAK